MESPEAAASSSPGGTNATAVTSFLPTVIVRCCSPVRVSQTLMDESAPALARRRPFACHDTPSTCPVWPSKDCTRAPSATRCTFTKRSVAPEASRSPRCEKSSAITVSEWGDGRARVSDPSATFQSLISPLRLTRPLPDANRLLSGENASESTASTGGPTGSSSAAGGVCSPPIVRSSVQTSEASHTAPVAGPPPTTNRASLLHAMRVGTRSAPIPQSQARRGWPSFAPKTVTRPS